MEQKKELRTTSHHPRQIHLRPLVRHVYVKPCSPARHYYHVPRCVVTTDQLRSESKSGIEKMGE